MYPKPQRANAVTKICQHLRLLGQYMYTDIPDRFPQTFLQIDVIKCGCLEEVKKKSEWICHRFAWLFYSSTSFFFPLASSHQSSN